MKQKKTYYQPCCGHCGYLLVVLAPRFHPASSCLWQWLAALMVVVVWIVVVSVSTTTHLTGHFGTGIPGRTRNTMEMGTVLHGFGKLKPVPVPMHTCDTLSRVYPYPCHALERKDKNNLNLYHCIRGTNNVEGGIHQNIAKRFGSYNALPCFAINLLRDYCLHHNLRVHI